MHSFISAFEDGFLRMLVAGGGALLQDKKTVVRQRKRPNHTVGPEVKVEPQRSRLPGTLSIRENLRLRLQNAAQLFQLRTGLSASVDRKERNRS